MKTCTKCHAVKDEADFYLIKSVNRRAAACKACYVSRAAEYKATRVTKEMDTRWYQNRRAKLARIKDAVFGAYGGYVCACCGETERMFLTIDHINNDGAKFRREQLGQRTKAGVHTYAWLSRNGFPAGVQVLCMNCQWGKKNNHGVCPHQRRRNDQSQDVEPSGSKRIASLRLVG